MLDTWWMTETGGHMIVMHPMMDVKLWPLMGKPLPGIQAAIIDDAGNELPPNRMGNLAIKGWPSMMYRIWNIDKI